MPIYVYCDKNYHDFNELPPEGRELFREVHEIAQRQFIPMDGELGDELLGSSRVWLDNASDGDLVVEIEPL